MKNANAGSRVLMLAAIAAAMCGAVRAADAPAFQNLRYNDSQETREQDLVYMKLGISKVADLAVGGQVRARGEYWENYNFKGDNDDEFLLTRVRLHADLNVCEKLRLFVEGRSAFVNGRDLPTPDKSGKRPFDEDVLDLENAFGDVVITSSDESSTTLRVGRQEMAYGKERVIGAFDWGNTRRTFDGAKLMFKDGDWQLDGFVTRLVQIQRYQFNDGDSHQDLFGAYASGKLDDTSALLDLYVLQRNKDGTAGKPDDERLTAGARLSGVCGKTGLDYDLEGGYQTGSLGDDDIDAWSIAAQLGYKVPECPVNSRLYVEYDYATGDGDPNDGEAGRYDQLYPTGHAFFGLIDAIGRQNIEDYSAGISADPHKKLKARVEGHWFRRAETTDGVFDAGGNQIVAGNASDARDIGQELDITLACPIDAHLLVAVGYGHFFASDVIDDAGGSDADTAYVTGQYTF